MAKYKLIKEFPDSPDLGTIQEFPNNNSWDEYWELVKEELNIPLGTKFRTNASSSTGTIFTVSEILKDMVLITWESEKLEQTPYSIKSVNEYFKNGIWIEYKEPELKVGDVVVLVKHRKGSNYTSKIGSIRTIKEFFEHRDGFELKEVGGFWFTEDVRLATREEIEKFQEVKISGYVLEMNNGLAEFGCQSFTKSELQAYKKLLRYPINAKIDIGNTIINIELLDKILDRF